MNHHPNVLRANLLAIHANAARVAREIADAERSCNHQWGPVRDVGEYIEGYTIPGDAPGTMGVDWRGPCYVPGRTIPKWERTCAKCGKVETTSRVTEEVVVKKTPSF